MKMTNESRSMQGYSLFSLICGYRKPHCKATYKGGGKAKLTSSTPALHDDDVAAAETPVTSREISQGAWSKSQIEYIVG